MPLEQKKEETKSEPTSEANKPPLPSELVSGVLKSGAKFFQLTSHAFMVSQSREENDSNRSLAPRARWQIIMGFALQDAQKKNNNPPVVFYSYSEKDKEYVKEEIPDPGRTTAITQNSMFTYGDTVVLAPMSNTNIPLLAGVTSPAERIPAFCHWYQENKPKILLIPLTLNKNLRNIDGQDIYHSVYMKVDFTQGIATIVDSKYYSERTAEYIEASKNIVEVIKQSLGLSLKMEVNVLRTQKEQDMRHCTHYATLGIGSELTRHEEFRETITSCDS
jgi:hypothetical protein